MARGRIKIGYKIRVTQRTTVQRHILSPRYTYLETSPVEVVACDWCGAVVSQTELLGSDETICSNCGRVLRSLD